MRKLISLFIVILISGCARQHKPDAKVNENWIIRPDPFPSATLAADIIPKEWVVVEDVQPSKFQVKDMEMVSFLETGEDYVKGEVMRKRAVGLKANLGLADAKYLLDHQAEIPLEFQNKYIVFPGTVLRGSGGGLHVPCLGWDGDRWVLNFFWVDGGFRDFGRLARSK